METISRELTELVASVSAKLARIDDAQAATRPAQGEWSRKEILGHLIDSAANNHQRFIRSQIQNPLSFPPYAQEDWVRLQAYNACPWEQLIELWKAYNLHLAWIIDQVPAGALDNACTIGDGPPVSLGFLITDYMRHMKLHMAQLGY